LVALRKEYHRAEVVWFHCKNVGEKGKEYLEKRRACKRDVRKAK